MTIQDILDAELSDSLKVAMMRIFSGGGKAESKKEKPSYEEWVADVNPDFLSDNYDLKAAYENLPLEQLEKWKLAVNSNNPKYYMDYQDEDGNYPYHLVSVVQLPNGNYMFLKKGTESTNPELHYETDSYWNGENGLLKTHDLIYNKDEGRYYYIKHPDNSIPIAVLDNTKVVYQSPIIPIMKHQEGGNVKENKTIEPDSEITIHGKVYKVKTVESDRDKEIGLSEVDYLPEDFGMLFIYDSPQPDMWYTMADTSIDLDIIFLDKDGEVTSVNSVKAFDPNPIPDLDHNAMYVLEVNINSGIEVGDELEDDEEEEFTDKDRELAKRSKMLVLDDNGDVQMRLEGGERIFSRISTRKIIKQALKAFEDESDEDYIKLGKMVFKELDALDGRDAQYVEAPK